MRYLSTLSIAAVLLGTTFAAPVNTNDAAPTTTPAVTTPAPGGPPPVNVPVPVQALCPTGFQSPGALLPGCAQTTTPAAPTPQPAKPSCPAEITMGQSLPSGCTSAKIVPAQPTSTPPAPPAKPTSTPPSDPAKPTTTPPVQQTSVPPPPPAQPTPIPPPPPAQPSNPPTQPPVSGSGDCPVNGALVCNGPNHFGLCNWGKAIWQPVATGTMCKDGKITFATN